MARSKHVTARAIVDGVLGQAMTREIWTGNYEPVLPLSLQVVDLSAVLPAVFYMFRFGQRRGKGKFVDTFAGLDGTPRDRRQAATIERVAARLAPSVAFDGFAPQTPQVILGDLLLAFCLENKNKALGHEAQIQRVAPAHYMAAWIDLPEWVAHLRYVPEMVVAMLADQEGEYVVQNKESGQVWFTVGRGFEDNVLLKAFHQGIVHDGQLADRSTDRFVEETAVGLDQLLMIRLAQQLGTAPEKLRGGEGERISNQRPIAERAARAFSEDMRRFVRTYATVIPRHTFVELLESSMALGLTTIVTSVFDILFAWAENGVVPKREEQQPASLFVDASNGIERRLRLLSEQTTEDFMRRSERIPTVLMALRLLDYSARYDATIKKTLPPRRPYATSWINLLGNLLRRWSEAQPILYNLGPKAAELAEQLEEEYPEAARSLQDDAVEPNPVWRMAEALTALQGRGNTQGKVVELIDSILMVNRPTGLAQKRSVSRTAADETGRRRRDVRSIVLTDSVLDYLVHLHVLRSGNKPGHRPLSYRNFLAILVDRYGLYVDEAPPGRPISNELLQLNRAILERRLRDLGLLVGVNDAESMKLLRPRFERIEANDDGLE